MKALFILLSCIVCTAAVAQKSIADALVGTWVTNDGKARIQIYKTGTTYAGKVVWLQVPMHHGKPKVDANNPNAQLRHRPILGLEILKGFSYDGDNVWDDGEVYDPEGGKTYSCKIIMVSSKTIKVRGYIGISLIGRTAVWTRG